MKRLDAVLSACSVGSRSEVKALIRKGKVTVNGEVVRDPSMSVSPDAEITVNGVPTDTSEFVYLMLNKPCGFVSTTDEKERNVLEFVPSELFRKGMFPVGRLDKDTSGLLFLPMTAIFRTDSRLRPTRSKKSIRQRLNVRLTMFVLTSLKTE